MGRSKQPSSGTNPRYAGLTRAQLRALIEIDERARHVTRTVGEQRRDGVDTIRTLYERAGLTYSSSDVLWYAIRAEADGMHGVAYHWYEALDDLQDTADVFRAFLVRIGDITDFQRRFGDPLPDERRSMVRKLLAAGDTRNLELAATHATAEDRNELRGILQRALKQGEVAIARTCAEKLGRTLATSEYKRLARYHIRWLGDAGHTAFTLIRDHELRTLARPFIVRALSESYIATTKTLRWARALRVPVSTRALAERLALLQRDGLRIKETVAVARMLARHSKTWRKRLPAVYRWARDTQYAWREPEEAERYGKRCKAPLTVAELRTLVRDLEGDARHDTLSRKHRAFALDLLAERVGDAIGAPPDAPATGIATAA